MRLIFLCKARKAPIGAISADGKRKKVAEGKWVPIPKKGKSERQKAIEAENEKFLAELFGTSEDSKRLLARNEKDQKQVRQELESLQAEYEDWASRQYKPTRGRVVPKGSDDPRGVSMSYVNERRRERRLDGIAQAIKERETKLKELEREQKQLEQGQGVFDAEKRIELEERARAHRAHLAELERKRKGRGKR